MVIDVLALCVLVLGMDVGDEVVQHVVVRKNPETDWSGREANIDGGNRRGQKFDWG